MVQRKWLPDSAEQILDKKKMDTKKIIIKIYMKILLWIQGWSGDLNSWAWTRWSKLHRRNQGTWSEGYKKWNEEKIKLFEDENNKDG